MGQGMNNQIYSIGSTSFTTNKALWFLDTYHKCEAINTNPLWKLFLYSYNSFPKKLQNNIAIDNNIVMHFDTNKHEMTFGFQSEYDLINVFYNYPLQLMELTNHRLLFHCGCFEFNGRYYLLSGESGVGKSTLLQALTKYGRLIADDTICLSMQDGSLYASQCSPFYKTDALSNDIYINSKGKTIKELIGYDANRYFPVESVYFIRRNDRNGGVIQSISGKIDKYQNILCNICMIKKLDWTSRENLNISIMEQLTNISMFQFVMINKLSAVTKNAVQLIDHITHKGFQ